MEWFRLGKGKRERGKEQVKCVINEDAISEAHGSPNAFGLPPSPVGLPQKLEIKAVRFV
jgi:hypothetical protein